MKNASPASRGHLLPIGCLLIVLFPDSMQPQPQVATQIVESAGQALKTYTSGYLKPDNYARFGFRSLEEAARARLGNPLPIALITLNDLKAYKPGTGARQLLKDARALWFPVMVGDEVRAKLEMVQKDSRWTAGEFGGARTAPNVGRAAAGLTDRLAAMNIKAVEKLSLVRVPALNAAFLLVESPSGEHMVPATTGVQKFGLEEGRIYTAGEVLIRLSEFAQKVDEKKVM